MGEVQVPRDALFGAQTRRALDNFPISDLRKPRRFVQALGAIKLEAANVNHELGLLNEGLKDANGRTFTPSELNDYRGARAQAGRIVPRGFSKSNTLG